MLQLEGNFYTTLHPFIQLFRSFCRPFSISLESWRGWCRPWIGSLHLWLCIEQEAWIAVIWEGVSWVSHKTPITKEAEAGCRSSLQVSTEVFRRRLPSRFHWCNKAVVAASPLRPWPLQVMGFPFGSQFQMWIFYGVGLQDEQNWLHLEQLCPGCISGLVLCSCSVYS